MPPWNLLAIVYSIFSRRVVSSDSSNPLLSGCLQYSFTACTFYLLAVIDHLTESISTHSRHLSTQSRPTRWPGRVTGSKASGNGSGHTGQRFRPGSVYASVMGKSQIKRHSKISNLLRWRLKSSSQISNLESDLARKSWILKLQISNQISNPETTKRL